MICGIMQLKICFLLNCQIVKYSQTNAHIFSFSYLHMWAYGDSVTFQLLTLKKRLGWPKLLRNWI